MTLLVQILLKALTNLPHTDFVLCKCLLSQVRVMASSSQRLPFSAQHILYVLGHNIPHSQNVLHPHHALHPLFSHTCHALHPFNISRYISIVLHL